MSDAFSIDVCLLSMPYAAIERPSIALGLLQGSLQGTGLVSKSLYPNIAYAREIGLRANQLLCDGDAEALLGEWTFVSAAFPDFQPDDAAFLKANVRALKANPRARRVVPNGDFEAFLYGLRRQAVNFIDRTVERVLALRPRIVGCTSIFQQHCASLALLRRLRERDPSIVTMIGGANCEGPMGRVTANEFPWVDFVVSGEADELFPQLCQSIVRDSKETVARHPPYGTIVGRGAGRPVAMRLVETEPPRATMENMNAAPVPLYDDYFEELRATVDAKDVEPGLVMETSRGCWWGAKHHCTFCGLNGAGMEHREKSPERALDEMRTLTERYGIRKFETVDNILTMSYFKTVLPVMASLPEPYSVFFETKSNLSRDQVRLLADAGIHWIQPGIEGLHDEALKVVDKGCTALGNVQLMKWSREYGIRVSWFILVKMPGDDDAWYAAIADWLPLIEHLQPPVGVSPVQYHRFSPYFTRSREFGLKLVPKESYSQVYPLKPDRLMDIAYYFDNTEAAPPGRSDAGLMSLGKKVMAWQYAWRREMALTIDNSSTDYQDVPVPLLMAHDDGRTLRFEDTRYCATAKEHEIGGLAYQVYKACDAARTPASLGQYLAKTRGLEPKAAELDAALQELRARKLSLFLDGKVLSLAIMADQYRGVPPFEFPGGYLRAAH